MKGGFSNDVDPKKKSAAPVRNLLTSGATPEAGKPVKPQAAPIDPFGNKPDLSKRRGIPGGA